MKHINWMYFLICAFLARVIATEANIADAIIFIACISYLLVSEYFKINKVEKHNDNIEEKLRELRLEVNATKDSVSAIRVGGSYSSSMIKK